MTITRTTLLDLPIITSGTETGVWGDITNNGLTQYLDIAIAGMVSLTSSDFTAGALTIALTEGTSGATNIANSSAQYATIKVSSLAQNSTITAPASNRSYRIINADSTYNLTIKASGQTGITFLPGQTGVVAFTGTDYEVVGVVNAASSTDNAVPKFDGTTGQIIQNTGVTIDDSNNVSGVAQLNATTADLTNIEVTNIKAKDGTSAGSIADSTGVVTLASSVLTTTDINGGTIDGAVIGGASAAAGSFTNLNTSGQVVFNEAGADVDFRVEGDTDVNLLFVDASADSVGIGTNAPSTILHINKASGETLVRTEVASGSEVGFDIVKTGATNQHWRIADGSVLNGTLEIYDVTNSRSNFRTSSTQSVFNESGADIDFRVEGDTDANLLFVDASTDRVGIGTSSPTHKLQVTGTDGAEVKVTRGTNDFIISLAADAGNPVYIGTVANSPLLVQTNGTERMRIQANGGLSFANTASPGPFNTVLGDRNNHFTGQRSNTVPSGTTSTMLTIAFSINGAAIVRVVDCGTVVTFNYFTNVYEYFITCYNGTVTATLKQSQLGSGAGSFITTSTSSSTFNVIQTADASLATVHDTAVDILVVSAGNGTHETTTITMAANN
jgi:hypothetical protein